MKKFTSFFAVFCCTMFLTAQAEIHTGTCGTNLSWSLNSETNVLDITGSGEMNDYEDYYNVPWYDFSYDITAINLPDGLTYIGSRAFYGCWNLYSITIPETVTEYGSYIFFSCNSLRTVVWNAKNAQARYSEKIIFSTDVTSFTFGNKVESIPDCLCYNMWQLTSITIPNSVTSIGERAFYECSGLSSITIPNSVTSIGNYAFQECTGLVSITIPENVTELGYNIFYQCSSLSSVVWNAKNAKRKKDNYGYEIFSYEVAPQITSFVIGNSVEFLPHYLCRYMNITSIVIPENVKEIGYEVFYGCKELRTVIWNAKNAKRSIAEEDYYNGSEIFYYEVAQNITSFTLGNAVEVIPDHLCAGMQQIPSITIPNSVTNIGNAAFSGCSSLPVITIPQNVTTIGDYAFSSCRNASVITVGNNVESIGRGAFSSNENLQVVNFLGTKVKSIGHRAFEYCPSLKSITLPDGVETLGESVFAECTFPAIVIPQSVKTLGEGLFSYNKNLKSVTISNPKAVCDGNLFVLCDSLESITAPASALYIDITQIDYMPSHMQSIIVTGGELTESAFDFMTHSYRTIKSLDCGAASNTALSDEAFKGCYNLQSLILPQKLTYISYMAVAGCKNLKAMDIPASVEEIEQSAFEDCRSLETLTFGGKQPSGKPGLRMEAAESKLRKIGNWAFYNAHQLQHLDIPEGVEEIGDGAFYGCTYLQDLVLPKSIKAIGDNCFALCSHLERIDVEAQTPPTIYARTLFDVSRQIPVYVPEDVVAEYLNDEYWKEMNIQGSPTGLEEISGMPSEARSQKIMRNGQLFIRRDGKIYNAQGARVE